MEEKKLFYSLSLSRNTFRKPRNTPDEEPTAPPRASNS